MRLPKPRSPPRKSLSSRSGYTKKGHLDCQHHEWQCRVDPAPGLRLHDLSTFDEIVSHPDSEFRFVDARQGPHLCLSRLPGTNCSPPPVVLGSPSFSTGRTFCLGWRNIVTWGVFNATQKSPRTTSHRWGRWGKTAPAWDFASSQS